MQNQKLDVPVDLSKPSNVVKNGVFKKHLYEKLVEKANAINTKLPTNGLDSKRYYDSGKQNLEKKSKMFIKTYLILVIIPKT